MFVCTFFCIAIYVQLAMNLHAVLIAQWLINFYIHLNKLACHLVLPVIYITVIFKIISHMSIILELYVEVLMYCFYCSCLQSANNLMFKVTIVRGTILMLMHIRKIFS